ncbi:MAG TPA: carboxypeptidase regulatory-like domain-containing protein [Terriglobales bacterium]|nr:carboxypeptidase regulatory-like domain-containing protein [Terriglobales bacterium]HXY50639.1 carboxypeptidase regulatory-like domain-containing protein [Terriglobales bacterium]
MGQAIRRGLALGLLLGLFGTLEIAWGQEVTAGITGTVLDPTDAPIKAATVTAKDTDRGTTWTAQTNDSGIFNLNRLPVGNYSVTATAAGFETSVYPTFTLVLNQTANIIFRMKLGEVSQTVEVSAGAPILQTQDTQVSTLIDAQTTESLPLLSRNYLQLALLVPGATNPNPQSLVQAQTMPSSGRPLINGNREQANAYYLDGVVNQEKNNNEVAYQPAPDAIQEFNVITQNPSAEFGDFEGGVISASIKSGTNSFHGSVWEFLRNDAFNANTWSAGLAEGGTFTPGISNPNGVLLKPTIRWNQFGGALGGPIVKDKLFFFVDYQGLRSVRSSEQGYSIFTPSEVSGDFGQLCTQNGGTFSLAGVCSGGTGIQLKNATTGKNIPFNNLPNAGLTIDSVISNLVNLPEYKAAEAVMINSVNGANYYNSLHNTFDSNQGDAKVDFNASQRDHIFGRWSQAYINNPLSAGFLLADPGASSTEPIKSGIVNWNHTFSTNVLNEARFGIVDVKYNQTDYNPAAGNLGEQIGIANSNEFLPGLPILAGGPISLGANGLEQTFHTGSGEIEELLIINHGNHTISTGFQYWRDRLNYVYPGNNGSLGSISASSLTGNGAADLWLGLLGGGGRDAGLAEFGLRGNIYGAFVQDDWRVTSTLTLNLGLRFEDHTPRYEIHNREVNFDLFTGVMEQAQNNNALYDNYLGIGDWEPRIGFAWSPAGLGGKTVFRGAIGTTSYLEGGGSNQNLTTNWPLTKISSFVTSTSVLSDPFPQTTPACAEVTQSCFTGPTRGVSTVKVWPKNYRPANEAQWNFAVQHQFNNTTSLQLGYVGSFATHLLNLMDWAQGILVNSDGSVTPPGVVGAKVLPTNYVGGVVSNTAPIPPNAFPLYTAGPASNANQSYNALQAVLKKSLSSGLTGQVSYTFSKCLSNSPGFYGTSSWGGNGTQTSMGLPGWQNIYDPRSDWGPCYYDTTHALTAFASYAIPVGRGRQFGHDMNPVVNGIVGGWEVSPVVSWHTGYAVTPIMGGFGDTSGSNGAGILFDVSRPNCSGSPIYLKQKVNVPGSAYIQWWSPSTYSTPASGSFGNCSIGSLRGPHYSDVDLSLHKVFSFTETKKLEFRSEFINLFNHPVLDFAGGPSAFALTSGIMGQINASQGERNIQFALKFTF